MAAIPGSVRVTGFIAPSDTVDTYPTHDALYGMDGLRSVADITARNAIPNARRRDGMLVCTQDTATYWRLLPAPWTGTNSDWVDTGIGGSSAITTGKTLWVDATFGNNATGLTQRQDKPFLTIAAAVAAAASGDLVMVRPGTYTVTGSLYKDGVTVYCQEGVLINYSGTVIADAIPGPPGGTFRILGYGRFVASAIDLRLIDIGSSTKVVFECESIGSGAGGAVVAAIRTQFSAGVSGYLLLRAQSVAHARTAPFITQSSADQTGVVVAEIARTCSAAQFLSVTGGALYFTCPEVLGSLTVSGGVASVDIAGSMAGSATVSGGALTLRARTIATSTSSALIVSGTGSATVACETLTTSEGTSDAVDVRGGTLVLSCSGNINGQITGVHLSTAVSTVFVRARTITCAATWRALWVEAGAGASSLHVEAQHIDGSSRGIQIDDDASVWLRADVIDADDNASSIAIDCDSDAATLVVVADSISSLGDAIFIQTGTARITANRVVAATYALRANNGGGGPIVSLEANIADLIESTGGTAISILCERFILGGSAAVRALAICASLAISGGYTATLKCGSMTATGTNSVCVTTTADGDADVSVDGPMVADLRAVLHVGAGDLNVRCSSITVSSATARAIDASGDTGSHLSVFVVGDIISPNRALYMDTGAATESVTLTVGGRMQGRNRVVDVVANGVLNLTAAEIVVEDAQTGIAVRLEAIDNWALTGRLKVGTITSRGAGNAAFIVDNAQVYVDIDTITSTDGAAVTMDNGADLSGSIQYAYGQGTLNTGQALTLSNFSTAQLSFWLLDGSDDSSGVVVDGLSQLVLDGNYIDAGQEALRIQSGTVTGRVNTINSANATGIEVVAGHFVLEVGDINGEAGIAMTSTGYGQLALSGTIAATGQTAVSISAGAAEDITGLTIQGGNMRGGLGVVRRAAGALYRVELRDVRIVSASTPGHCLDVDGTGDFIIAGCQLVTTAGAATSVEGNGNLKVYSGCVATQPVAGTITELVDNILVDPAVT